MRLLYNIIFPLFFVVSSPYYLWKLVRRGHWLVGLGQRFGFYGSMGASLKDKRVLWLHGVSVGEANLAIQLVNELRKELKDWTFVVSTTTTTGMGVLKSKLPEGAHAVYYPIDWMPFVKCAFRNLNPSAVVLVEAEIWPNLFWEATSRNVSLSLVNTRLSEKSLNGYRKFGFLFKPLFQSLCSVGVQDEVDAQRVIELGCQAEDIVVTGNMKFDGSVKASTDQSVNVRELLDQLGVSRHAPVIVAGSTFEGEELILSQLLAKWRVATPDLFLVVVPRHFERADSVLAQIQSTGLHVARRTRMESAPERPEVLLVDTTGELTAFYEIASLVFIGKSLTAQGGQNPIEAAALGKPLVFGPFMQNFRGVASSLLDAQGAQQILDEGDLFIKVDELLSNPEKRELMGKAATEVVNANKGATQRTALMLKRTLRAL